MLRALFSVSFSFVLALMALPILRVPLMGGGAELQKGMLAALLLGAALAALGVLQALVRTRPLLTPPLLAFAAVPLACVALISAIRDGAPLSSYAGIGFEPGTVAFFALFAAVALVSALLNRSHIRIALVVLAGVATAAGALSLAFYSAETGTPAWLFSLWPHLSFLLGLGTVVAAAGVDGSRGRERLAWAAATLVLLGEFAVFYHPTAAAVAAATLTLFAVAHALLSRRIPAASALAAGMLAAGFFTGAVSLKALPPDVRLSPEATRAVGSSVYLGALGDVLLGAGPDTFGEVWEKRRPPIFNTTALWQTTFREGFSTVYTWLVTLGWLSLLAYAFIPIAVAAAATRALIERGPSSLLGAFPAAAAAGAFLFASGAAYNMSLPLLLCAAAMLGFCARLLNTRAPSMVELSLSARLLRSVPLVLAGLLLIVAALLQMRAAGAHALGVAAFERNDVRGAQSALSAAAALWPSSLYARDASRAELEVVRLEATGPLASTDGESIKAGIARARGLAERAVRLSPGDFAAWLSQGSILTTLVIAGAGEVEAEAGTALSQAHELAPNRPEPQYLRALLANTMGRTSEALRYAREALELKSDYEPALSLVQKLGGTAR